MQVYLLDSTSQMSVKSGRPVRVVRGSKVNSSFAPEKGYVCRVQLTVHAFTETISFPAIDMMDYTSSRVYVKYQVLSHALINILPFFHRHIWHKE